MAAFFILSGGFFFILFLVIFYFYSNRIPKDIPSTYKKAVELYKYEKYQQSIKTAESVLKIASINDKVNFINLIAMNYIELKQYSHALKKYQYGLEIDKTNFTLWKNIGILYRKMDQLEMAEECYLTALDLNPESDEVLTSLGVLYLFLDRPADAITLFHESLEINDHWGITYGNLALAYALVSDFDNAESALKKAVVFGYGNTIAILERINELKGIALENQIELLNGIEEHNKNIILN